MGIQQWWVLFHDTFIEPALELWKQDAEDMLRRFPSAAYNTDYNSALGKLMRIIGEQVYELRKAFADIRKIKDADQTFGKVLDQLAWNEGQLRGKATDAQLKALLKGKYAKHSTTGRINHIIDLLSMIFGISINELKIEEGHAKTGEPAAIFYTLPLDVSVTTGLGITNLLQVLTGVTGAGIRATTTLEGTFQFSSIYNQSEFGTGDGFDEGTLGDIFTQLDESILPF